MFWDNLTSECTRQGIKVTPLLKELGISTGNLSSWKKGGNVHSDSLLAISKKLGVSTDYLLTGKKAILQDSQSAIICANRNEENLISMYRDLPARQQDKVYSYIQGMYDSMDVGEKSAV